MKTAFENRVVIVSGGSSGIGLAISQLLSALGAHVWIVARDQERLELALEQVKASRLKPAQFCGSISADVTRGDEMIALAKTVTEVTGPLDIVVNSAGDVYPALFSDSDLSKISQIMELDYMGTVNLTHACLPAMIKRGSGHIVNISSVYGFLGGYGYSAYCAAKYAVRGFSDSLRAELKPLGINVSIVFPQNTQTPQLERENALKSPVMKILDSTRVITAESVARDIIRGIAKKRYMIFPGMESRLLFLLTSIMPYRIPWLMDSLIKNALHKVEKASN